MLRVLVCVVLVAAIGCGDDSTPPERVPFTAIDPNIQPKRPNIDSDPEPVPAATTAAPVPPPQQPRPQQGRLQACCSSLQAQAVSSNDPGRRANAANASRVCLARMEDVQRGKMSVDTALSQVRSSMLGASPPACR
jgi:hypothetical protein